MTKLHYAYGFLTDSTNNLDYFCYFPNFSYPFT